MKKVLMLLAVISTLATTQSVGAAEGGECWFDKCRIPTPNPTPKPPAPPKLHIQQ